MYKHYLCVKHTVLHFWQVFFFNVFEESYFKICQVQKKKKENDFRKNEKRAPTGSLTYVSSSRYMLQSANTLLIRQGNTAIIGVTMVAIRIVRVEKKFQY